MKLTRVQIKTLKEFGPGLITGAADDDPSGVATYTITGAQTGYRFLWTAIFTWPLMASVQIMCAQMALATKDSLTHCLQKKFPRKLVFTLIVGLLIANTLNVAADLAAMADALELLTGYDSLYYLIFIGILLTIAMIFLSYQQIARALIWMTFFLLSYILTAMHSTMDWPGMWHGTFYPSLPKTSLEWATIVAILGTTISPYLFFWQASQEVEEINKKHNSNIAFNFKQTNNLRAWDIILGTFLSNLIMFFVILTAANSLNKSGITDIQTTKQAAQALEPLLGTSAVLFYTIGLLGVGLLAIPTLVGSAAFAMADFFKWESGLDKKWNQARSFYLFLSGSMIVAVIIDFLGVNPIKALFYSAILNGLLSPVLIFAAFIVASDKKIMHGHMLKKPVQFFVLLAAFIMCFAGIGMWLF